MLWQMVDTKGSHYNTLIHDTQPNLWTWAVEMLEFTHMLSSSVDLIAFTEIYWFIQIGAWCSFIEYVTGCEVSSFIVKFKKYFIYEYSGSEWVWSWVNLETKQIGSTGQIIWKSQLLWACMKGLWLNAWSPFGQGRWSGLEEERELDSQRPCHVAVALGFALLKSVVLLTLHISINKFVFWIFVVWHVKAENAVVYVCLNAPS